MFSEDYIVRLIRQAAAVLVKVIGLKKAGQYREAEQAIRQALEGLTNLPADLIERLDDNSLLDHLKKPDGSLDVVRLLLVADLTREAGDLYELQDRQIQSAGSYLRALTYYLEAAFTIVDTPRSFEPLVDIQEGPETLQLTPSPENLAAKIEATSSHLNLEALPPETIFNLYLFYSENQNYAKAVRMLAFLEKAIPGEATIRQERDEFFARLSEMSDVELERGGLSREDLYKND